MNHENKERKPHSLFCWFMVYLSMLLVSRASSSNGVAIPDIPASRCFVAKTIDDFDKLDLPPNLIRLRLYSCTIEGLENIGVLKDLRELDIRNCRLDDLRPLAPVENLSHLILADNQIGDVTPLKKCRKLTFLDLRRNGISDVSPLSALRQLSFLDLRNNPLDGDAFQSDLRVIKESNPNAKILVGLESHIVRGKDLHDVLVAKANVDDLATNAPWRYFDKFPNLPSVSNDLRNALALLRDTHDREYMGDVTIVLVRYAADILAETSTGTLLDEQKPHPLVAEFLATGPKHELGRGELHTSAIVHWAIRNRERLASSPLLDAYLERYKRVEIDLERGWIQTLGKVDPKRQDALDTNLPILSDVGGNSGKGWLITPSISYKGSTAMTNASGLGPNERCLMVTTTVKGPGTISFWLRTDADVDDYFEFGVDSVPVESYRTLDRTPWHQISHKVGPGEHFFQWLYQKENLEDPHGRATKAVWIDYVHWAPTEQTIPEQ